MTIRKSATRIDAYRRCQAYYGYKYIQKIPTPQTAQMLHGIEVHNQLEEYFKGGDAPTLPEAIALLRHLPEPHPDIVAEGYKNTQWRGHTWTWIADLSYVSPPAAYIFDHKTTSESTLASAEWRPTPEKLITGTQMPLYAGLTFEENPEVERCTLQWNYVTRGKRNRTLPVVVEVDRKIELDHLVKTADAIDELHATCQDVNALPKNLDACGMYGGCPYAGDPCRITSGQKVRARRRQETMKLAKSIKKKTETETEKPSLAAKIGNRVNPPPRMTPEPKQEHQTQRHTSYPETGLSLRQALHVVADAVCDYLEGTSPGVRK